MKSIPSCMSGAIVAFPLVLIVVITLGCAPAASAQYAIKRQVIASGGGKSTGGHYRVNATLGQTIALQVVTAGKYKVAAGFWGVVGMQTEGAPTLKLTPAGEGYVTLSWKSADNGWVLQETTSLSSPRWVDCASSTNNPATMLCTGTQKFFRLHKP